MGYKNLFKNITYGSMIRMGYTTISNKKKHTEQWFVWFTKSFKKDRYGSYGLQKKFKRKAIWISDPYVLRKKQKKKSYGSLDRMTNFFKKITFIKISATQY